MKDFIAAVFICALVGIAAAVFMGAYIEAKDCEKQGGMYVKTLVGYRCLK